MCLAIPGKIIEISEDQQSAIVDFDGLKQKVIVALLMNPKVGKYVIVHAGYAIEQMNEKDALEATQQWKELAEEQNLDLTDIM